MGEVEKDRFIALSSKVGDREGLCPQNPLGKIVRSFILIVPRRVISSRTFFWWVGGEVSGSQHH